MLRPLFLCDYFRHLFVRLRAELVYCLSGMNNNTLISFIDASVSRPLENDI